MPDTDPRDSDPLFPQYLAQWREIVRTHEGGTLSVWGERHARAQARASVRFIRRDH